MELMRKDEYAISMYHDSTKDYTETACPNGHRAGDGPRILNGIKGRERCSSALFFMPAGGCTHGGFAIIKRRTGKRAGDGAAKGSGTVHAI